jgi:uncharacterized protein (DUF433 family)
MTLSLIYFRTAIVEKKFQTDGGDDIEDIADEFDCTPEQVTAAIEFENLLAA